MYDSLLEHLEDVNRSYILEELGLEPEGYALLTVHRPKNADDPDRLGAIVNAVRECGVKTMFPIHPRTRRLINSMKLPDNLALIEPLSYMKFLRLLKEASFILTDSGGVQKEAFRFRTPCVTLRRVKKCG